MAIPEPNNPKSDLRKTMRRMLREIPSDSRPVREAVHQWLATHPDLLTIAVYAALPGEVDLSELVASHPNLQWAYPRVSGQDLTFHEVRNPSSDLVPGAFGILEPSHRLAVIPLERIDAFLCPGLAYDARGGRLGRGRGYYDRMLANARPDAKKIGVCFPHQIVADTFAEPHDIHMDELLCGVPTPNI